VMQGIFHPGYQPTHQLAGMLLGIPHMSVIKGEGGEIERNPDLEITVQSVHNGEMKDETWPPMFDKRHVRPEDMNIADLIAVWSGEKDDEYAAASVVGTVAVTLYTMGRADNREAAEAMAWEMWNNRNKQRFSKAA
jgi:anthranilate phosphoribosyltransferase